jgi:hypothetical protein
MPALPGDRFRDAMRELGLGRSHPDPRPWGGRLPTSRGAKEANPEGIPSLSPGLRGTSYPGCGSSKESPTLKGLQLLTGTAAARQRPALCCNPFRVEDSSGTQPRVARASQPWAERYNPLGIEKRHADLWAEEGHLGEGEHSLPLGEPLALGLSETWTARLPLPRGEGGGEGELDLRTPSARCTDSVVRVSGNFCVPDLRPAKPGLFRYLLAPMLAATLLLGCSHAGKDAAAPAAPEKDKGTDEEAGPHVTRDAQGRVVISMSDKAQGRMGLIVKQAEAVSMSPELKGYGRVLDPAPLIALANELALARAAYGASSNELARLKTLAGQGNTSERALQAAQAAALRDQLMVQSAEDRLALSWGKPVAGQTNLAAYFQALTSLDAALVRIDLPLGEALSSAPTGAHIATLSGHFTDAEFIGPATSVDPQMQGQGFLFLVASGHLTPGEAVTGYLKLAGQPLTGVVIPREAVVRTEAAGWVYVLDAGGKGFTRVEIALDHPTKAGWFLSKGVAESDYVVVNGAQQLLSLELKGQGGD